MPFTDTKRLASECGIKMQSAHTHEISSVFMYDMMKAYGGVEKFYTRFYINSPFPLAIIRETKNGQWLNANYYDDIELFKSVKPFLLASLKNYISMGIDRSEVFVLGKRNMEFIRRINDEHRLFSILTVLEHPRYIQQYKSKDRAIYIEKYIRTLNR